MDASAPPLRAVNLENRTVQRILEAALVCWSRDGLHGASLKAIAAEAGVAKSLLHYHFASKEHLLIELQALHYRQLARAIRERLVARGPSVEGALHALDEVWEAIVGTRHQFPFALEIWRASLQSPAVRARLEEFQRELLELVHEGVLSALGPLASQLTIPPGRLAALLQVAFEGFSLRLFQSQDAAGLRRVFEDFKQLMVATLATPQGGPA